MASWNWVLVVSAWDIPPAKALRWCPEEQWSLVSSLVLVQDWSNTTKSHTFVCRTMNSIEFSVIHQIYHIQLPGIWNIKVKSHFLNIILKSCTCIKYICTAFLSTLFKIQIRNTMLILYNIHFCPQKHIYCQLKNVTVMKSKSSEIKNSVFKNHKI